jgi:hypothetical protein
VTDGRARQRTLLVAADPPLIPFASRAAASGRGAIDLNGRRDLRFAIVGGCGNVAARENDAPVGTQYSVSSLRSSGAARRALAAASFRSPVSLHRTKPLPHSYPNGRGGPHPPMKNVPTQLETIEKILQGILTIASILQAHWFVFAIVAAAILIVLLLRWWAYASPQVTLEKFLRGIVRKDPAAAWPHLHAKYQSLRWRGDVASFVAGYRTTQSVHISEVAPVDGRSLKPLAVVSQLFARSVKYDVLHEAVDRFVSADCQRSECFNDLLAAQVADYNQYCTLRDGRLIAPEGEIEPTISLRRAFKKRYTLERESAFSQRWAISNIETTEIRILLA